MLFFLFEAKCCDLFFFFFFLTGGFGGCAPGFYKRPENSTETALCFRCPSGEVTEDAGLDQCKECPPGSWSGFNVSDFFFFFSLS